MSGGGEEESGLQALTVSSKVEVNQHPSFFNILGFIFLDYLNNNILIRFCAKL
jgi:hypothetical protein